MISHQLLYVCSRPSLSCSSSVSACAHSKPSAPTARTRRGLTAEGLVCRQTDRTFWRSGSCCSSGTSCRRSVCVCWLPNRRGGSAISLVFVAIHRFLGPRGNSHTKKSQLHGQIPLPPRSPDLDFLNSPEFPTDPRERRGASAAIGYSRRGAADRLLVARAETARSESAPSPSRRRRRGNCVLLAGLRTRTTDLSGTQVASAVE